MSTAHRRWLQIHLSTAVVLMIVAGALVGANVFRDYAPNLPRLKSDSKQSGEASQSPANGSSQAALFHKQSTFFGWPFVALEKLDFWSTDSSGARWKDKKPFFFWKKDGVIFNALIAAGILVGVGALCEWWIRRRMR